MKTLLIIFSLTLFTFQSFAQCGNTIVANDVSICSNDYLTFGFSTDGGSYQFLWTNNNPSTGIPSSGFGNSINVIPTNSGVSTIYIEAVDTIANCPTLYDTVTITVLETPVLVSLPDISACANTTINFAPFSSTPSNPNTSYGWSNYNISIGLAANGIGEIPSFTAINTTNICQISNIVVYAWTGSCASTPDTFSITVCPLPMLMLTSDSTICSSDQLELVANGFPAGGSYLWNTQETNDTISVSPISSTLFTVSYQTVDGCSATDSVMVGVTSIAPFNLTDTTICQGGTVVLSAGASSLSCDLAEPICSSNSVNFPNLTNTTAPLGNNYDCLGTQPNPSWFYFQIDQPGDLTLDITQSSNFSGSGLDVDFIVYGPYSSYTEATSYCGNLGAATSGSGLNTVVDCSYSTASTETANLFNTQTGEIYVMMLTNFANEAGTYNIIQTNGSASLDCAILNNNTSPTTYLWSNGETTPWITVIPSNTNIFSVTVTSNGCESTDSSMITVNPVPGVTVNDASIISGQSATLTAVGSPSGGIFLWDPTGDTTPSITVSPTTSTDYSVTYTLNGCSSESTATVNVTAGLSDNLTKVISIFPNPAQSKLTLEVDEKFIGSLYKIIDQQGRILKSEQIQSSIQEIAISDYRNGIYTIQIGSINVKFIKN